jgi:hypothetical protein
MQVLYGLPVRKVIAMASQTNLHTPNDSYGNEIFPFTLSSMSSIINLIGVTMPDPH